MAAKGDGKGTEVVGKQEVKHMIISQSLAELNESVAVVLSQGWKLLEARLQIADYTNNYYSVFYIFARDI